MLNFSKKHWFHILVWILMLLYLSIAPSFYAHFILKNGKPIQGHRELPADSKKVKFAIDGIEPIVYKGEDVYILTGWAFLYTDQQMPLDKYEREVVLISDSKIYFFPIFQMIERPDIQSAFSNLEMDLTPSGFNVLIAKEALRQGKYRVGIVFRDPFSNSAYYYDKPAKYIIRTPNNLYLQ